MDEEKETVTPEEENKPERPPFTPPSAPLNKEEKAYINNAAYSQVVVYDSEKESYVLREPEVDPDPIRETEQELTDHDVRSFTALHLLFRRNARRISVVITLAVIFLLFSVAGLLFRSVSTVYDAQILSVEADTEPGILGYGGNAVYGYVINGVSYTGNYAFHEKETEYIPRTGDTIKISSFNLMPSWSFEERFCIPGILQGITFVIACFLFSDGIGCILENSKIRKYFRDNNILYD